MKKSKAVLKGLGAVAAAAGLGVLAAGEIMWFTTLTNKGNKLGQKFMAKNEDFQNQFVAEEKNDVVPEPTLYETAEYKDIHTLNSLGEIACAVHFPNEAKDKWVILCHGYTADPASMERYARQYYKKGFNIIMPYMRGHEKGIKTKGHTAYTMGWWDRIDLLGWIDYAISENPDCKIMLHGESMGAATVMMTLGENPPANVVCAVEDCGYTSVWDEFTVQMGEMFGLPEMPFMYTSQFAAKRHIGLDFKKASPLEKLKNADTPLLFIHGEADDFVPFRMVHELYNSYNGKKELLTIPKAAHAVSVDTDPDTYWAKVWSFAEKYIELE